MRDLVMATRRELAHGSLACLTWIGDSRPNARGLEQNSFAYSVARDLYVARLESRHHFRDDGKTGDDDVRTIGFSPSTLRRSSGLIAWSISSRCSTSPRGIACRVDAARGEDALSR